MSCDKIITISRQYGSGGHEIGVALAKKLGIAFYDKELISLAAKESGIAPEVFEQADEKAANSLLYSLSVGLYNYGNGFSNTMGDLPVNDKLYILQHRIMKEKAEKECFVIVGRCADYILRNNPNVVKIFIYADMQSRMRRAVERLEIAPARAKQAVVKLDKTRANYYSFYSGQKWGQADNFDLCINTTQLSTEQSVDLITKYLEIIG
ncbi:MAG: cytidylate kinase-like family protein [Ruminococcus sp.]|nr:cytidylate kinase-like family protein [Ruminococcus sp.]